MSDLTGRKGEPFEMRVELGKIREFARATKSSNPAYFDGENPVSPATFLMTARFWLGPNSEAWGDQPPDVSRLLHGEQEFVFHGPPPRAGARLMVEQVIDKVYEKEGKRGGSMEFIEVVNEFRDETGAPVADVRTTLIVTSKSTSAS